VYLVTSKQTNNTEIFPDFLVSNYVRTEIKRRKKKVVNNNNKIIFYRKGKVDLILEKVELTSVTPSITST
jgi:hypothetical protein